LRKVAIAISLALVFLLVLPLASDSVVSHYRRWQASKLLATVRELHPGTTTEAQARAALKPFSRYEERSDQQRDGTVVTQVEYQFYNSTDWTSSLRYHLRFLPLRITLPWTLFEINLDFVGGVLGKVRITEMQEDRPGFLHPNAASVSLLSNRLGRLGRSVYGPLPADFNGYSEHSQSTGEVDQKGNWTGFSCCHTRSINLDERATPAQLSQSLTSSCIV
jgi:hypothetical protein